MDFIALLTTTRAIRLTTHPTHVAFPSFLYILLLVLLSALYAIYTSEVPAGDVCPEYRPMARTTSAYPRLPGLRDHFHIGLGVTQYIGFLVIIYRPTHSTITCPAHDVPYRTPELEGALPNVMELQEAEVHTLVPIINAMIALSNIPRYLPVLYLAHEHIRVFLATVIAVDVKVSVYKRTVYVAASATL